MSRWFDFKKAGGVGLFALALGLADAWSEPEPFRLDNVLAAFIFSASFFILGGLIGATYAWRRSVRSRFHFNFAFLVGYVAVVPATYIWVAREEALSPLATIAVGFMAGGLAGAAVHRRRQG